MPLVCESPVELAVSIHCRFPDYKNIGRKTSQVEGIIIRKMALVTEYTSMSNFAVEYFYL